MSKTQQQTATTLRAKRKLAEALQEVRVEPTAPMTSVSVPQLTILVVHESRDASRKLLRVARGRKLRMELRTKKGILSKDAYAKILGTKLCEAIEGAPQSVKFLGATITRRASFSNVCLNESATTQVATQELIDTTAIRGFDPVADRLRQRAVTAILGGTSWLTSKEVGTRADPEAANKHELASRWATQGRIFAIERTRQKFFPDYEFDPLGKPIPEVKQVLEILKGFTPFRVASWFESTSSLLGGKRPRELLVNDPQAVVAAARAHVEGPLHG